MKKLVEFIWFTTQECCLLVNLSLVKKVHSNLNHSSTCTLTVTSLEEPELTFLYSELHILHIMVVLLQLILEGKQLCIKFRHSLFHRRILSSTSLFIDILLSSPTEWTFLSNLLWSTDTCNNILTLCVDKILTIEEILTSTSITREANTCSRAITHITKYHSLYGYGCTPLLWNTFHLTIKDSTLVHPWVEHSAYSTPQLLHRIIWKFLTGLFLDSILEEYNKLLQVFNSHLVIKLNATLSLNLLNNSLEWVDILLIYRLHAQYNVAVHLYKTTITVISKTCITCLLNQSINHSIIKTKVKNGIHHTRHRSTCTWTYTHQQRVRWVSKGWVH